MTRDPHDRGARPAAEARGRADDGHDADRHESAEPGTVALRRRRDRHTGLASGTGAPGTVGRTEAHISGPRGATEGHPSGPANGTGARTANPRPAARTSGLVNRLDGLGPHDHVCWRYPAPDEFRARVREFLVDGLARNLQVWYVATGSPADLLEDLRGTAELAAGLRTGAARVVSLDATYPVGAVLDPAAQVRAYAEATGAALAEGHAGLRVAADCTPLVRTPEQLAAFARYENAIDHYMADRPFSALCAYSTEVGDAAFGQLACMHPSANDALPGFRLHAAAGGAAVLGGELDPTNNDLFALALARSEPHLRDGLLEVDGRTLEFIDHRALARLSAHADGLGATVVLRTSWPGAATLVDLLGLSNIRVESAA
ncbi:MEDS domain-containing protein [Actinosynnema sp. NPDC059335]|uniref:MEDS domain-containing protein n=1 Tax=Actinosynnema sp. NPDC059335 TaxID=3346804 RepID=UPI003671E072